MFTRVGFIGRSSAPIDGLTWKRASGRPDVNVILFEASSESATLVVMGGLEIAVARIAVKRINIKKHG